MRLTCSFAALATVVTVLAGASSASAAVGVATFTGKVISSNDVSGVFGTPGASLVGLDFTETWTFETGLGVHGFNPGVSESNYGGSQYEPGHQAYNPGMFGPESYNSPTLFATLKINGITADFLGDTYGNNQVYQTSSVYVANSDHSVAPFADHYYAQLLQFFTAAPGHSDFQSSFSINAAGFSYGAFTDNRAGHVTSGELQALHYTLQVPSSGGVPEPATWAMMIGGFGMTGVTLRRRRERTV